MTAFLDMPMARAAAESLMLATCTVTRTVDEPTWDEESGTYTPAEPLVIYRGRCKVQDNTRSVSEVLAGERRAAVDAVELHLPIDGSEDVRRDDDVLIDASPLDTGMVGRRFTVQAQPSGSLKTARRFPVEAVF